MLLEGTLTGQKKSVKLGKLDRIYTHKFWRKSAVVLTVILGLFASFIPALPIMVVASVFDILKNVVQESLASANCSPFLIGLICDVGIQSMSFVVKMLGFVFGVTLVFGLLEEVGVMARISYVFDNTMGKLGLQGKSVMSFLVSFGCTMGGAAGARVIDNWGQKVPSLSEVKGPGCAGCAGCNAGDGSPAACKGCIPQNASDNMGNLWEVV